MPSLGRVALGLLFAAVAASAGCTTSNHRIVANLPMEDILTAPAPRTARPTLVPQGPTRIETDRFAEWIPPVAARPWRWVVVHHSATDSGSAEEFDRSHRQRGWDELGYDFVITNGRGGPDGQVQVGSRWLKQKHGAHCKTPDNRYNDYGIGICLVGNFENSRPTAAQIASLCALTDFLCSRYDIPASCVIGHGDAPETATKCPGQCLSQYLAAQLRPWLETRATLARR